MRSVRPVPPGARQAVAARAGRTLLLAAAILAVAAPGAFGRGGKDEAAPAEWSEEDGRTILKVRSPSPMKAYLVEPAAAPAEGAKAELLIALHGHGGTATGLLQYGASAARPRDMYVLACEGSTELQTDQGMGHSWSDPDVKAILACLDATLARVPRIDARRVVLLGHSAGGTMSLRTYQARPAAFAGVCTSAAPMTPSGAQKGARVVVMLGTKDGNFAGFQAAVAATEKAVVGRVLAVTDLEHKLPHETYAQEALAWLLDSKAPSETLRVPFAPDAEVPPPADTPAAKGKGHAFRVGVVFEAGHRGAPAGAPDKATAKAKAAARAAEWKKAAKEGVADLVAAGSDDPLSKEAKGIVTGHLLARYGGPLLTGISKLKGGDVAGPLECDAGWLVVARDP
ncbi:MAG TPA: prolyl oligopeptidase family serine peptidase [Planctomycetota bacterium]|nr:prolyl oligopeptidase family serine peptidase [Planctomycetota bacterium]